MQNKTKSQNANSKGDQNTNLEQGSNRQVQSNSGTSGGLNSNQNLGKSGMKSGKQPMDVDQTERVSNTEDADLEDKSEGDELSDDDIVEPATTPASKR